jgi:hypothetical protein
LFNVSIGIITSLGISVKYIAKLYFQLIQPPSHPHHHPPTTTATPTHPGKFIFKHFSMDVDQVS